MCKPPIYSLIAREEQFIYEALNIVEEEKMLLITIIIDLNTTKPHSTQKYLDSNTLFGVCALCPITIRLERKHLRMEQSADLQV